MYVNNIIFSCKYKIKTDFNPYSTIFKDFSPASSNRIDHLSVCNSLQLTYKVQYLKLVGHTVTKFGL